MGRARCGGCAGAGVPEPGYGDVPCRCGSWEAVTAAGGAEAATAVLGTIRILRPGGTVVISDLAHVDEYVVHLGRLGVIVCGTGLGVAMAANRHAGVRAAPCTDPYAARMTRQHNDANVLCLGSRIVGPGLAEDILVAFLESKFEGGRHAKRVAKIEEAPR